MPWSGLLLVGISVDIYAIVGETVMSLCRSENMPISMLWSVLVSSRGNDGRTKDDRGKDVVPK